jgi:hypothetical protein
LAERHQPMAPLHPDTNSIDPYEVAYLHGGGREVLRLQLLDLVQRGHLHLDQRRYNRPSTRHRIHFAANPSRQHTLTGPEVALCCWFALPKDDKEIRTFHLREPVASACARHRRQLEGCGFIRTWSPWTMLPSLQVTKIGRSHLRQLREQFRTLRDWPGSARLGIADPALLAAVGVFGTGILSGTSYEAFARAVGVLPNGRDEAFVDPDVGTGASGISGAT